MMCAQSRVEEDQLDDALNVFRHHAEAGQQLPYQSVMRPASLTSADRLVSAADVAVMYVMGSFM